MFGQNNTQRIFQEGDVCGNVRVVNTKFVVVNAFASSDWSDSVSTRSSLSGDLTRVVTQAGFWRLRIWHYTTEAHRMSSRM